MAKLTAMQVAYVKNRATGMAAGEAARAAGYMAASAKVSASRMERNPRIRDAIAAARAEAAGSKADSEPPVFQDAESYLRAVVTGTVAPDPVRVGAARALLPFEKARQRAPIKSATPKQLARQDERNEEQALLDAWAERAAAVRARLKQT